ncbi:uncharacterized protein [Littorina saxatilis]|uniref:Uncharacterized protein n=1 Tax=Littorina saxatilis TaxID=31220 RepID=A0AAN9ANY3_9CAEN
MDTKAVFFLCVVACALLSSCAMSLPDGDDQSPDELDVLAETVHALETIVEKLKVTMDGEGGDGGEMDSRRRRSIPGMHLPYVPRYRGGPRRAVYRPRHRPGSRVGPRPNYSPY